MSIKFSETNYETFGKCLKIENEICELYVTLELGPRIIRYALKGYDNMLKQDTDKVVGKCGPEYEKAFYKDAYWCNYGGHRLWTSPEAFPETYYPDNDPVSYEIKDDIAIIYGNPQMTNNIKYTFEISLEENSSKVTVNHIIENIDDKVQKFAPWSLTVMDPGGLEIIPKPTTDTGLLPNCVVALWPYSHMDDERLYWGNKYITIQQNPNIERAFKLGLNNEHQWIAYLNKKCLFIKRYTHLNDAIYPDFGVSFETYTDSGILEIETLGELREVNPNEKVKHTEYWELKEADISLDRKNEDQIENFAKKFVSEIK